MLAKARGAKRKRDEEMDVDGDASADEGGEEEWMDVDADETSPAKRAKANSGAVVAKGKREPRSNRQVAGMRDAEVGCSTLAYSFPPS